MAWLRIACSMGDRSSSLWRTSSSFSSARSKPCFFALTTSYWGGRARVEWVGPLACAWMEGHQGRRWRWRGRAHREGVELLPEVRRDALPQEAAGALALVADALEGQVDQAEPHGAQLDLVRLQRPARTVLLARGQLQVERRHHDALVVRVASGANELHQTKLVVSTVHAAGGLDEGGFNR